MPRWSRRWQAGETSKDHLKEILDGVSARTDWPKGSAEQLAGDFYAACMDEKRIAEQGIVPVKPPLDDIDAMKVAADIPPIIRKLHGLGVGVPFGLGSFPDFRDPTQVIAAVFASGLGLPDRDYYFKTEDRFKKARDTYRAHVATVFELAGSNADDAKSAALAVFKLESALAAVSLDNVALRSPKNIDHKVTFEKLDWMTPETKKRALEKLAAVSFKVGYPDKWQTYTGVTVTRADYWADQLSLRRWNTDDDRGQIGKPLDRDRWFMTAPTSDASYNSRPPSAWTRSTP